MDKFCEASTVDFNHSIDDITIHNRPSKSYHREVCYESDCPCPVFFAGMIGDNLEISGDNRPSVRPYFAFSVYDLSSRMLFLMAGLAERNTFDAVSPVKIDNMFECFLFVSVKIVVTADEMVKLYNVMAFEIILGATRNAACTFISLNPFRIRHGLSYTACNRFKYLIFVLHETLYSNGTCMCEKWDLHDCRTKRSRCRNLLWLRMLCCGKQESENKQKSCLLYYKRLYCLLL